MWLRWGTPTLQPTDGDAVSTRIGMTAVVVLAVVARLYVATVFPWNYDMGVWLRGWDLYRTHGELAMYREGEWFYGPVWFHILYLLGGVSPYGLHMTVSAFLTFVDVAIAALLWRWYGALVGTLFLLNPISICISGQHRQFDALAILIGMVGARFVNDRPRLGSCLLGVSLATKHILFLFPVWLFLRPDRSWRWRWTCLLVPYAVFVGILAPYWWGGTNIIARLSEYRSTANAPLWFMCDIGQLFTRYVSPFYMFCVALIACGAFFRRRATIEGFWIYTCCLVALSSALANQYLTIPVAALAVGWNRWAVLYVVSGTLLLLSSPQGLQLASLQTWLPAGGELAVPFYRTVVLALLLHLATREAHAA